VADFLDRVFQLGRRDLEFFRPIGDFVALAQCDQRAMLPPRFFLFSAIPFSCRIEKFDA
jgi:hypothetical protein